MQSKRKSKRDFGKDSQEKLFNEIIELSRVAKVTAGAKRLRFKAVIVVGDKNGRVGIALAHGADAPEALRKATEKAKKKMIRVPIESKRRTIPHRLEGKYKAARVLIKPARSGTGVVAGGPVRKVLEIAGYQNVVAKRLGSSNPVANAYCTFVLLTKLRDMNRNVRKAA